MSRVNVRALLRAFWINAHTPARIRFNSSVQLTTSIDSGFAHSVAVVMATRSYREGKKLYWDREKEEIVEQLPAPHGPEERG